MLTWSSQLARRYCVVTGNFTLLVATRIVVGNVRGPFVPLIACHCLFLSPNHDYRILDMNIWHSADKCLAVAEVTSCPLETIHVIATCLSQNNYCSCQICQSHCGQQNVFEGEKKFTTFVHLSRHFCSAYFLILQLLSMKMSEQQRRRLFDKFLQNFKETLPSSCCCGTVYTEKISAYDLNQ